MDYDQIIAQALSGINPMLGVKPPPLNTGTPMLPPNMVSSAVTNAMTPGGAPVTADDRSTAMAKIGMSLMQPRMPGQSVAGNIGTSLEKGSDYLDAAKVKAQNTATQQAQLGVATQTADTQNRVLDAKLQEMAVKFPMEVAEIQQRLKKAALENKQEEYNAIVAALKSQPEHVIELVKTELAKKQADVKNTEATANFHQAYADFLSRGGKDKTKPGEKTILHTTKAEDGSVISSYMNGSDGPFYEIMRPGIADQAQAMKAAEKQLKGENSYGFFSGPTPKEIKERAQKLMTPQVINIDGDGQPVQKKPAVVATDGKPTMPANETPAQRRDAAGRSLKLIEGELQTETDPEKKAALQKEYDRVKLETTSENPHAVGKAANPASAATPRKVETWTPDRVNELLGAKGAQTPETGTSDIEKAANDAEAAYKTAMQNLRSFGTKGGKVANKEGLVAAKTAVKEAKAALDAAQKAYEDSVPEAKKKPATAKDIPPKAF